MPRRRDDSPKDAPVVDANRAGVRPGEPERVEGCRRRGDQLDLGERSGFADDVDVALHELAVAALLWSLGPPHRRDLDRAEHLG